jgi:glycosyltransferase involved in cell wall biosynthesis
MRILLSAAAISPYRGSEPAIGWKVAKALTSKDHEVHVLTFRYHEADLERAEVEGLIPPNLTIHFVGSAHGAFKHPLLDKLQHWRTYFDYVRHVRKAALELMEHRKFDVIHHVTFATWRTCVPLHSLGVPYVWGPVGGSERLPLALLNVLSPSAGLFELVRIASGFASRYSDALRKMIRSADAVIASHRETYELLEVLRGNDNGLWELSVTAFTELESQRFSVEGKSWWKGDRPLRAFCGGMMEGRKGVALALHAIAQAKSAGIEIEYTIAAHGPEVRHLERLCQELGLGNQVRFIPQMKGDEYSATLRQSDIYLLPSLRDNAPITLMEAMLCGCVPVIADCGGPRSIVANGCGFKTGVSSRNEAITGIRDAFVSIHDQPEVIKQMGLASRERILHRYSMSHYMETLAKIYSQACEHHTNTGGGR